VARWTRTRNPPAADPDMATVKQTACHYTPGLTEEIL
jgi:hypothetical protein